ncbi:tripartite tricarboxylate transporter substrate binding protein [Variovorax sp. RCC_210]|jgi:tripartite-type tricarboxylate transporter receptor subunit TctC|uniref:Bug family tripartite tricarboxylate transporter substrate binding protein n=1 Tax=Variovorax sp. RCC_210 TaxID=3239217 RepID=UPI000D5DFE8C
MNTSRRQTLATGLATGLSIAGIAALPSFAWADPAYPNNVVKFIIPTPAGGGHDTMMRVIGQKLTEAWGQPSIVESKAGASGAIAAATVARATPDGYTLLVNYSALISNLVLQPTQTYKMSELAPISMLALTPIAIGVRESLNIKTLKQLVDLAKSKPGKISYGSYGPGSGGNFVGELLNMTAGIDTVHVPYKGEAPALQDLIGGQIDTAVVSLGGVSRYPGKIRALAVASPTRFPLYPDVPTFAEAGYPDVVMPGFGALFAPAGTPKAIIDKLSTEMARIVKLPDVAPKLLELGFEPAGWGPAKLSAFLTEQLELTKKLVATGRIKL